jgi:hypothetical protein
MMTVREIMIEVCKDLLRECRIRQGLHPIYGDCPQRGVYVGMEG